MTSVKKPLVPVGIAFLLAACGGGGSSSGSGQAIGTTDQPPSLQLPVLKNN